MEAVVRSYIKEVTKTLDKRNISDYFQYRNEFLDMLDDNGWNVYRPDGAEIAIAGWIISVTFNREGYHYLAYHTEEPQIIDFYVKVKL